MITVTLNEITITLPSSLFLQQFLHDRERLRQDTAVMVNRQFVPKSDYPHYPLQDGDAIVIVEPMQGG